MKPLSSAEKAIDDATQALYKAFSHYSKPPVEECVDTLGAPIPESARSAWSKSLRGYTADEVSTFGLWSLCMSRDSAELLEEYQSHFKFWLPRFLQGLAEKRILGIVFEEWFIVQGFKDSGWPEWPETEVAAVRSWAFIWLDACLACTPYTFPRGSPADQDQSLFLSEQLREAIEFADKLGFDPMPQIYIATKNVDQPTSNRAVLGNILCAVKSYVPEMIVRQELENADAPGMMLKRKILRWLLDPSTTDSLEQAFFEFVEKDEAIAAKISDALEWLTNLRMSYANSSQSWPDWLAK